MASFGQLLLLSAVTTHAAQACSTVVVGKGASVSGAVLISHSDDGEGAADPRLLRVPGAKHAKGSMRNIYWDTEDYPRYVGTDFGPEYANLTGHEASVPIGAIPQVAQTYGYWDGTYGHLNDAGIAIGESTCSGVFASTAVGHGGHALFSIDTLTKLAMERMNSSKAAVQFMGKLAEEFGFYGASGGTEGGSENINVGDQNEAWVLHMMPTPCGKSAIWVARRVPDDEVTVVMNMFTIREVNLSSPDFMYSKSMLSVAKDKGWWKDGQAFDFTAIYSKGEYVHKYYSGRRIWGAYRMIAPSQKLSPSYGNLRYDQAYPWSIKPDLPLDARAIMAIHRDWYAGTDFDQTQGLAAGAFGAPDRFTVPSEVPGHWERTIGLFRTTFATIEQLGSSSTAGVENLPVNSWGWYGAGAAHYSVFVPLPATMSQSPSSDRRGSPSSWDLTTMTTVVKKVGSVARTRFKDMIKDIQAAQDVWEGKGVALIASATAQFLNDHDQLALEKQVLAHADAAATAWNQLAEDLLCKYANGYLDTHDGNYKELGYPRKWLDQVGYKNGPPNPPESSADVMLV